MNKHLLNLFLYSIIVVLPTLGGSYIFSQIEKKQNHLEQVQHAEWVASIHKSHWDQFISETVTSLQTLSLTSEIYVNSPDKMAPLLRKAFQTDPRYSGLFLLNEEGRLIVGSNNLLDDNLHKHSYIQEVIRTKDIIISADVNTLKNNQKVIGLASPVLDEHDHLTFITLALLRVDHLQNIMKILTPETPIVILNQKDQVIIDFDSEQLFKQGGHWVSTPMNQLPWMIKVKVDEEAARSNIPFLVGTITVFFILTHILFLLVKYILLKRQSIKERKQNEAQKLELVGTLAAGTAHEIRNPLTGIKGLVQLLSEKHKEEEDQFYFSVINDEIKRINQIVSEFLILGKPTAMKNEPIDIRMIIYELKPLISSEANLYNIMCQYTFPEEPVSVLCTKDQMKQVILNLTRNAFESMPTGGTLEISISKEGRKCVLTVLDSGVGIGKEELEKIFHPFYTSKASGTGLGLVVCKRIVQSFHGDIQISSMENKGTTVDVIFPLYKE
jgi:two-component system, sporulation sensor kinase D